MPIMARSGGAALPVATAGDVAALVELLGRASTDHRLRYDLADQFAYVAGVHPGWFRPHQQAVVAEGLDGLDVGLDDLCALFDGAPDSCVEHLERRLRHNWSFRDAWALAAIGTEVALTTIADLVRAGAERTEFEKSGVWTPARGPAQRRFSPQRRVVERRPVSPAGADHPVGLPLQAFVRNPQATTVVWHYLSLRLADVPGMPAWPAERGHLAGPKGSVGWVVSAATDPDGRWHDERVTYDWPAEDDDEPDVDNDTAGMTAAVALRPYGDDLVYANGQVLLTSDLCGVAGGPAIGLYPNPHCRSCGRLMFHVTTVKHTVREHGHGWRSLYLCEDCRITTCTATNWN
jgi:hypothetical protein